MLSFYSTIQNERASALTTIILLDNPALDLHVDGQRDIKKFLEESIANNAQVIYVTHSPAMVDVFKLEQIRKVELKSDNIGTKIHNSIVKEGDHLDILEPLRSAIGSNIGYSLIASNYNILVEGMADKYLLEGFTNKFLNEMDNIVINGSLAEDRECVLARVYKGLKLPFVAILDNDSSGRGIVNKLKAHKITDDEIVMIGNIFPDKQHEFSLADLVSENEYYEAVKATYSEREVEKIPKSNHKIENLYEKQFKDKFSIGFSKVRVALTIKMKLQTTDAIDSETRDNFIKLIKDIQIKLTAPL